MSQENNNNSLHYKIIRQPYRITMAEWDYSVIQKRILTVIISKLQREIYLLNSGYPIGQLDLFKDNYDTVELTIRLNDFVKNDNNYSLVKKALQQLRNVDIQILLPAVTGRKSKQPETELVLTGLIERAIMRKYDRTIKLRLHRVTALELVKVSHGLTSFAEEVMLQTNNSYTQKIYELISHWKDKETIHIPLPDLRKKLHIEHVYPNVKEMVRRVIKPAEKELKEIGDIFFVLKSVKSGNIITGFNFIIKHRKSIEAANLQHLAVKEDTINQLRIHFHFRDTHFELIKPLLENTALQHSLRMKIANCWLLINSKHRLAPSEPRAYPNWLITCLKNEFPGHL